MDTNFNLIDNYTFCTLVYYTLVHKKRAILPSLGKKLDFHERIECRNTKCPSHAELSGPQIRWIVAEMMSGALRRRGSGRSLVRLAAKGKAAREIAAACRYCEKR